MNPHTYWAAAGNPRCVSSCRIFSGSQTTLLTTWVEKNKKKKKKNPPFSVIAMCLTGIIATKTTCGSPAIEMQMWKTQQGCQTSTYSHIRAGRLVGCLVSNCAQPWGGEMWFKTTESKPTSVVALKAICYCTLHACFHQNLLCIFIDCI